ncbi:hypothetical protein BT96DRAFT_696686 [Gymnopus androsaceus JB14]|uniref:Uncharacterized protein n=1 Tax=Gymnopus androsaceus JB14 TaxID=1447944 RepID=A0A6A4IF32_9AGAR|nr:hypothetical protein BT96DRAFT_696686 [Gymnopus androsaceus JB14]
MKRVDFVLENHNTTTWRNLHWLPHSILVYEIRVQEGYGHSRRIRVKEPGQVSKCHLGYSKSPMTENGHEVGGTLLKPWRKIYVPLVRLLSNVPFYTILNLDYLPPFLQWEEVFRVFSIVSGKTT